MRIAHCALQPFTVGFPFGIPLESSPGTLPTRSSPTVGEEAQALSGLGSRATNPIHPLNHPLDLLLEVFDSSS